MNLPDLFGSQTQNLHVVVLTCNLFHLQSSVSLPLNLVTLGQTPALADRPEFTWLGFHATTLSQKCENGVLVVPAKVLQEN